MKRSRGGSTTPRPTYQRTTFRRRRRAGAWHRVFCLRAASSCCSSCSVTLGSGFLESGALISYVFGSLCLTFLRNRFRPEKLLHADLFDRTVEENCDPNRNWIQ